jgi:hypothetical protein
MKRNRRAVVAVVLSMSVWGLAACSAKTAPEAEVPTLPATSAPASASDSATAGKPADPDAGRPRERLDMTDAERDRQYDDLKRCLTSNGLPHARMAGDTIVPGDPSVAREVVTKAEAACRSKIPLPPWELDPNNPHAADFNHAVVQCLRGKGVKVTESSMGGAPGFSFDDGSAAQGLGLVDGCQKQAVADGLGR